MIPRDVLLVSAAYLIGSVPFGYLLARFVRGLDIRTVGSGNIGATNVGRVMGRPWGILVFALDVLKGFLPIMAVETIFRPGLVQLDLQPGLLAAAVGLATVIGHNWPVFLRFRGGKGVATTCGVFLALFWQGVLISAGVWAVAAMVTRYVSLASMLAGVALLVSVFALREDPLGGSRYLTALAGLGAVMSVMRHRGNIQRLLRGAENKIGGRTTGK